MKQCELCNFPARSYCESDDAYLCWSCDDKVHGANFLVARHIRTLVCRNCQSLTPWKASGPNLGRTVSVCNRCINNRNRQEQDESEADDDNFTDEDDDLVADVQGGGINGENQVVPLSPTTAPPAVSSSSSSHISSQELVGRSSRAESSVDGTKYVKRALNDNTDSSSGRMSRSRPEIENPGGDGGGDCDGEAISVNLSSPLKELKTWVNSGSRSASNIKIKEVETLDLSARRNVRRRIEGGSW